MKTLPIVQLDAFTTEPFGGNPCAVVFDAGALSDDAMQRIALEMNLSETAFVMPSAVADVRARYFTPAEEIPLAGHPTIATIQALLTANQLPTSGDQTLSLELTAGIVAIGVTESHPGPARIAMTQRPPVFGRTYDRARVAHAFGLAEDDILPSAPVMTVSTGTPMLMVPLASMAAIRRARMDLDAYGSLKAEGDFFSPHLFVLGDVGGGGDTFARHFGVPPDTAEDPFTGSATGAMGAYLWHHGLISTATFVARQGDWMGRPGRAEVEISGPRGRVDAVTIAGRAVEVMRGTIAIPE